MRIKHSFKSNTRSHSGDNGVRTRLFPYRTQRLVAELSGKPKAESIKYHGTDLSVFNRIESVFQIGDNIVDVLRAD